MRFAFSAVASLVVLSALSFNVQETEAKSLSNRNLYHPIRSGVVAEEHVVHSPPKRRVCSPGKKSKKSTKRPSTSANFSGTPKIGTPKTSSQVNSNAGSNAGNKAAQAGSSSSSTHSSTTTHASTSTRASTTTTRSSTSTHASASASPSSSSGTTGSPSSFSGPAPPKSPWGSCFDLTATAFQPNWKGEATTTWCGVNFDKSSPIIALPLAQLSQAYGSSQSVTYYSNEALWKQMVSDWCGREVWIQGPGGPFKAYFGDANEWTSVDVNMNLFTHLKGVATGSYADPDAAGWMNGIQGCFTGNQISIKNGYPFSYN